MKDRQNKRNVQDNPEVIDAKFEEVEAPVKKENFLQKAGRTATKLGDRIDARKRERALKRADKDGNPKRKKILKGVVIGVGIASAAAGAAFVGNRMISKAADTSDLGIEFSDGEDELESVEYEGPEDDEESEGETPTTEEE